MGVQHVWQLLCYTKFAVLSLLRPSFYEEQLLQSQLVQVYLSRWQQTDMAVKVLSKVIQNLSPQSGIVPQDPSTLKAWRETSGRASNILEQVMTNASSVSNGSSAVAAEENVCNGDIGA